MTDLAVLIQLEIQERGPLRFDRFMDLALYHPIHGYYRKKSERPRAGRQGDFFTSVSVGPLFGRLLARQFLEMWENLNQPETFWIAEQGCEDAQLACDILEWTRAHAPQFHRSIRYALIEPHLPARVFQQGKLASSTLSETTTWFDNPSAWATQEPSGVFFSNELIDAFPVRLVRYKSGAWHDRCVELSPNNSFSWIDVPTMDKELVVVIAALQLPEIEGYVTEINLNARAWMRTVAQTLRRGYVLTLDYGFPAHLYYAPFRTAGTLSAYRQHRRVDPLAEPGSSDLTAHVDFTSLAQVGASSGLQTLGFLDQQHFLTGIAHDEFTGAENLPSGLAENLPAWNTLTHPSHLGSRFHALLQGKDAPPHLSGLRHARPHTLDGG